MKPDNMAMPYSTGSLYPDPSMEKEKEAFFGQTMLSESTSQRSTGVKSLLLAIIGACVALTLLLGNCLPTTFEQWRADHSPSASFSLVKHAVAAPSATPSSTAVLEVFQVYQPVLTPSGATDDTTTGDGSENTTTIAQSGTASSCEVTLMVHSFGYSYGMPFVGK